MPWFISKVYPPTIKHTPDAPDHARKELAEMGPLSVPEWIMLGTFVLLLALWIGGTSWGISATSAAFFGIAILLVTKVLTWKDMANNSSAWSTLIFFAVLVGMADQLKKLKVVDWVGDRAAHSVAGMSWPLAFGILILVYFYIHYMFASNTAQIVALRCIPGGSNFGGYSPNVRRTFPQLYRQPYRRYHSLCLWTGRGVLRIGVFQCGRMVQAGLPVFARKYYYLGCCGHRVAIRSRIRYSLVSAR